MPPHIVVVGSINMDLVVRSPRHPLPGETLIGGSFRTIPGGKGANQAVAAARLGSQVTLIGCLGDDAFGQELTTNLENAGVSTRLVGRSSVPTGVALITVSATGENTIIVAPGANNTVLPSHIVAAEETIARADALLVQLEVPVATVNAAVALAHRHGVRVILNPAPAQPLPEGLLQYVSFVVPNEHETALLSGGSVATTADAIRAAQRLRAMGAEQVVLTLGPHGALLLDGQGEPLLVQPFVIQAVDTTAAGDAFMGAFAVALTEGRSPREAVAWGCAAGALACTVMGAQPSLPTRQAVESLLAGREIIR